ncbi:NUDIX domain-containing protein [Arthrobacter sp. ISL-48]|uniref:NUDIX domain-containing protein n=1 Tax=Arthrobacter sp. ISL-48 TaxID=2819110 RepID=UPI001BEA3426|nr:NUDIX domain-containing protein [Arthrobacter sp. ISL-48]MBT2534434.1 NUDIX domain-containing protein [Arthrobacter sp. ISL-48]
MSSATLLPVNGEAYRPAEYPPRTVVAVILEWRGRIALFKRSQSVGHDRGRWHCITGYLEPGTSPEGQAIAELREETGLTENDLIDFRQGAPLLLPDHHGNPWLVHTFTAVTRRRRLTINDEHDTFRWAAPSKIRRYINRVAWLDQVLEAAPVLPDQHEAGS